MRWLLFLLVLACIPHEGAAQTIVTYTGGPDCLDGEAADHAEPHDATRALRSIHAVTTDGFGARYIGTGGREVDALGIGATSILDDGALGWRAPTDQAVVVHCPPIDVLRVYEDGNRGRFGTVHLAVEAGNETGDPGPLRYLDPTLPNVDKIGPDYEAGVYVGPTATSLRWRDFLPTNPAIAPRIFDALDDRFPKRKGLSGVSHLDLDPIGVSIRGLVAEDLPFEETLGREVPTLRRQIGGTTVLSTLGWTAVLDLDAARLDRPSWSRLAVTGPDWKEVTALAEVHRYGWNLGTLQARLRPIWASGPGLRDGSVLWGEVEVERFAYSASVSGGPSGIGGGVRFRPSALHSGWSSLAGEAYASRDLPEAAPNLPFWVARGYSGLASDATPLLLVDGPRPVDRVGLRTIARHWTAPITVASRFESSVRLLAKATVEARRGETVYLPSFTLADEEVAVRGPGRAVTSSGATADVEAQAMWAREEIVYDALPSVYTRFSAWANARLVLAGDDAFRLAREREPTVRLGALAEHSPDGKLSLNARLEWRSATRWDGWPEPDLPAALLADLGLDFSFNRGVYTLGLRGRNVLGVLEQTHPLGATLDGRLFVRLEARLGGWD